MTKVEIEVSPIAVDTPCPACGYNLRGLVEPKCPECGLVFTWIDAVRWGHGAADRTPRAPWPLYALVASPLVLIVLMAALDGWGCVLFAVLAMVIVAFARRWIK